MSEQRISVLAHMGVLADRGLDVKSTSGRRMTSEWMAKIKKVYKNASTQCRDAAKFLDAAWSSHLKLRTFGETATSAMWLQPSNIDKIRALLPSGETNAMFYLPWSIDDAESNRMHAHIFLPLSCPLMDLALSDVAWCDRQLVQRTILNLTKTPKKSKALNSLELPFDAFG